MTDDLSSRLLEAIARREKAASEAQPGPWHIGNAVDPTQPCNIHTFPGVRGVADNLIWLDAEHIIWHDPDSVLRLCQAHRAIVELYRGAIESKRTYSELDWSRMPDRGRIEVENASGQEFALNKVIFELAAGYDIEEGG